LPESYNGGLGSDGTENLKEFVRKGGSIMAFGQTSMVISQILELPVSNPIADLSRKEFYAPGSLVRLELDQNSALSYGLTERIAAMVRQNPVLEPSGDGASSVEILANFQGSEPNLSGFLLGSERLSDKGAIAMVKYGEGKVVLSSINPQFRAMTTGTYKLILNALFLKGLE